jgi:hypothetical protein
MNMRDMTSRWIVIGLLAASPCALAQQKPPPDLEPGVNTSAPAPARGAPRPQDLEPGVNTSAPTTSDTSSQGPGNTTTAPKVGTSSDGTNAASNTKPSTGAKPAASAKASTNASTGAKPATNGAATAAASNSGAKGSKEDRLQLDTTQITGNQELPKVLYIVPWKRADLGDLLGKPANSLLDEVLQPVDRDVFKRENRYYDALKPDAAGAGDKPAGAAGQVSGDKH